MAVRILVRPADQAIDRLEHAIADVVLENLGVGVDLGPVEAEHPHQEGFEHAVAPHHGDRGATALGGEARSAARLHRDQPLLGEAREHVGDGRRRHTEPAREVRGGDASGGGAQLVQRLEVVLPRARERRGVGSGSRHRVSLG
jgi:hypothetical protein